MPSLLPRVLWGRSQVSLFFASVVSPVLSDTDIYFLVCLIYLLFFICLLGDSKKHSKCKRNFEDIFNRTKDISKSLRWVICLLSITVIYHAMSLTVLSYIEIGICCFSAMHTVLRCTSKDCLAQNHDNVSEWNYMSIRWLLSMLV
jgi:hypothetical protein